MADEHIEQEAQPQEQAAQFEEDFDWNQFFTDEAATAVTDPAPAVEAEPNDDLRQQLAQAQADSAKALELAMQAQTQSKMQTAVEAWKAQASPAEKELADLLLDSKTPEELQKNAEIVKRAAAKLDATAGEREAKARREMELKMQQEYGFPVMPTFTPMPEEEKVKQLLKEGDLDSAAAAMLKGVFNS